MGRLLAVFVGLGFASATGAYAQDAVSAPTEASAATEATAASDSTAATDVAVEDSATEDEAGDFGDLFGGGGGDFGDFGDLDLSALLDTEVESASSKKESISDAPAVIEVITPAQIRAWGSTTLNEALLHIANIEINESYWGYTSVNMRGLQQAIYNSKILLLIDGVPLYEFGNMSFHIEQIPINAIERVEVIRGPGAVLYGTNAFAGVIHVFTRKGDGEMVEASVRGGYPASGEARVSTGLEWENGFARLSVQGWRTPEWEASVPRDEDQFAIGSTEAVREGKPATFDRGEQVATGYFRAGQAFGDLRTEVRFGYMNQVKKKWGPIPNADIQGTDNEIQAMFGDVMAAWSANELSAEFHAGYSRNWRTLLLGPFPSPERPNDPFGGKKDKTHLLDVDINAIRVSVSGGYQTDSWGILAGVSSMIHGLTNYRLVFETDYSFSPLQKPVDTGLGIRDYNGFLQVNVKPVDDLSLTAGARYNLFDADAVQADEPKPSLKRGFNPRAGLVYRISDKATMKVLYGRAFRIPSLYELYVNSELIVVGDAELKPEIIDTAEFAIDLRPVENVSVRFDVFRNQSGNEIGRISNDGGGSQIVNSGGSLLHGAEATLRWVVTEELDASGTVGFQEGARAPAGWDKGGYPDPATDIANVTASFSSTYAPFGRTIEITPTLQVLGKRAGFPAEFLVDATAYYNINENFWLGLIGKNLTDRSYRQPELGRRVITEGMYVNQPLTVQAELGAQF